MNNFEISGGSSIRIDGINFNRTTYCRYENENENDNFHWLWFSQKPTEYLLLDKKTNIVKHYDIFADDRFDDYKLDYFIQTGE